MKLHQLKYFIEVVLSGSINEAARRLYISQPTLSKAIKELENDLGIVLFTRTSTGISLSPDGAEFLSYARQINEQVELLERRYFDAEPSQQLFSVSSQHYSFVVDAFVEMIRKYGGDKYQFTIRETRTYEIIDDVKNLTSEIGVLYISAFNEKVLLQLIKEKGLKFTQLFEAHPHIFISKTNPLAKRDSVTLEDLDPYPRLAFEQGEYNSFYYSEEVFSTIPSPKSIQVSDRATLFNLLIGLDGYTISTGILSEDLDSSEIVQVPLEVEDKIKVGWVVNKKVELSRMAKIYLEELSATTRHML
ncbi:LysR family transcriptional regulator [Salinicoccus roseus]|jgi:DNA-binding transcriptional LysR family regulator|uniref:LysR family transcriptional regulator n=1 Tax=Salinicoccus roseus TaxID=45670 RepID=A0A0C2HC67_9STAP|nr:LysR family transcriptional regulator [Salinicoccus roseus]KIH71305.1 LysR family transcriptional regulator [Salinicoccus roseus]MBY8909360.1 LysR family transcriptional regulator [Salinicoccus roseus]MDB0580047.1 LysR family transcriptional regulator [Salinicoccus roseus]